MTPAGDGRKLPPSRGAAYGHRATVDSPRRCSHGAPPCAEPPPIERVPLRPLTLRVARRVLPGLILVAGLTGAAPALGATVMSAGGTVTYNAATPTDAAAVNALTVKTDATSAVVITDATTGNTITPVPPCAVTDAPLPLAVPTNSVTCPAPLVPNTAVNLTLGDGADSTTFAGFDAMGAPTTIGIAGDAGADNLKAPDAARATTTLTGGLGADMLVGGTGRDVANFSDKTAATTVTIGTEANDGVGCTEAATPPMGCEGDLVGAAIDDITGGSAADVLVGDDKANTLTGGGGDDTLRGGGAADVLLGDAGNDTLDGGLAGDTLTGGDGTDLLSYALRTAAVTVDLTATTATQGEAGENDKIDTVENVQGGAGDDALRGSPVANELRGGAGNDTVSGGAGATVADVLDGGTQATTGGDTVDYADRTDALNVSLDGMANDGATGENDAVTDIENVTTGAGADTITASAAVNVISSGAGTDNVNSRDIVADTVNCGADADTLTGDRLDVVTACETADLGPEIKLNVADAAAVVEGDTGAKDASFAITLDQAATFPVEVTYSTVDGTATAGSDYTAQTMKKVTFAPGETTKAVTVPVLGDTIPEATETFDLVVSAAPGTTLVKASARATITDDDTATAPTVTVADVSKAEGNSGTSPATFTVRFSSSQSQAVSVNYATSSAAGDTATAGTDYTAATGKVTIPAGQTSATFDVPVLGDTTVEPNETFTVTVSDDTSAAPVLPATPVTAKGTITDDDTAGTPGGGTLPTVSVADARVAEGNSGQTNLVFAVSLSAAATGPVTVEAVTLEGSARQPSDFAPLATRVAFAAGEQTKAVTVKVVGDTIAEADEAIALQLSNPVSATLGRSAAFGIIVNDDASGGGSQGGGSQGGGSSGGGSTSATKRTPKLTLSFSPKRDRSASFTFRAKGKLKRPSGVSAATGCKGRVTLTFKRGRKTVKRARATLRSNCTYSIKARFKTLKAAGGKAGTLRVAASFGGNDALKTAKKTGTVRVG